MIIAPPYNTGYSVQEIGAKAISLLRLHAAGYDVPRFIIIPAKDIFLENSAQLAIEASKYFDNNVLLAVRSSADVEDNAAHSFAGQFTTLLNVSLSRLPEALQKVWNSAYTKTVIAYMQRYELPPPQMSVIVQEMVAADFAGVAFGMEPLSGDPSLQVINIVTGLGEDLVNGSKTADTYHVKDGIILQRQYHATEIATDEQLKLIAHTVSDLGRTFGTPQDVEFAFANGKLKLLQSRPITTLATAEKIVYDNSNIVESYPGLTLPLTFSFIEKMYSAVYIQLSKVLGISAAKIKAHRQAYDNMLGLLNGRVYYNLNSWYTTLSLLPGYNINAGYMEAMMGVKDKPQILAKPTTPSGIKDYFSLLKPLMHIVYNAWTVKKQKAIFIKDFHRIYDRFAAKGYSNIDMHEILADYQEFEALMLAKWKAPLVNDFFAMIYFGLLQKLCAGYMPQLPDIHNRLLSSSKDIITTQPLVLLPALTQTLLQQKDVKEALLTHDAAYVWNMLQQEPYQSQKKAVIDYLQEWGERCVAELKLETITYKQEPQRLIGIIQQYAHNNIQQHTASQHDRADADNEAMLALKGKPLKRFIFQHVLRRARYLVSNRENLRYYRTLGFGMVRTMMTALGEQMHRSHILQQPRDIFYLNLTEIQQSISGKTTEDLQKIVADRKKDYELYAQLPLPERIITNSPQHIIVLEPNDSLSPQHDELRGIPCSPGVVRATVCKISSADSAFPGNQVMATYATDPGYVVLFAATKGILTERGSLLSHAAIVSREMNIPCIVGIPNLMSQLNDGDEIIMDGSTGIVKIINRHTA